MSIQSIVGLVSFSALRGDADDDSVDRLNHIYTVLLLLVFAVISTGTLLAGDPIACLTPANFPGSYDRYVRSYCYVQSTYYIPMDESIPLDPQKRESQELTYYQWVPFIFLFMAFLFKLPCYVWRLFNQASGIDMHRLCDMVDSLVANPCVRRKEGVERIAIHIDRWLKAHRFHPGNSFTRVRQYISRLFCVFGMKRNSSYLSLLYLSIKFLYVVNVVGLFFLLNSFLGEWHLTYGIDTIRGFFSHDGWKESPRFPKVTLCDFDIRQLENIQRYTVQCTLNVNIYFDKLFFFLWFWLVGLAIVTAGSFIVWVWRVYFNQNHRDYVTKYLVIQDKLQDKKEKMLVKKFVRDYLRDDGVFLLRVMARNCNIILLSDIIGQLFVDYKNKNVDKDDSPASPSDETLH